MKQSHRLLRFFVLFCTAVFFSFQLHAQTSAAELKVIPEVKQFDAGQGTFSPNGKLTILVSKSQADSLMPIARQLKEELKQLAGISVSIKNTQKSKASKGEVLLQIKSDIHANIEAYQLQIEKGFTIVGATRNGTFWGTRTLLQLIDNYDNTIPQGTITDFPDSPKRGFMIDAGRKFFSMDFLRYYVKFMSYYKMNEFQVHLNDNGFKKFYDNDFMKTYSAFRLESDSFPGLTARDGHYTKKEFRELQQLGMQYGVNVIPEIDVPAHALAFTQYKPELAMNKDYMDHLSISAKDTGAVYSFIDKLFREYTTGKNPVFVGPDFHIGTDEYDRRYAPEFYFFTDRYIKFVENLGYRCRLWGGMRWMQSTLDKKGITTRITNNKGSIINAWSHGWVDANQQIRDGFKIINTCDEFLYIVPGAGYYRDTLDTYDLYRNFRTEQINSAETILPELRHGLIGGMFAVWNDVVGNGISQQDVHFRALPAMKVVSTKLWNADPRKSFADYQSLATKISEGPGLNMGGKISPEQKIKVEKLVGNKSVKLNGKQQILLNAGDLGYNYDIQFDLFLKNENSSDAILFSSHHAQLTLNTGGQGKLGFTRDGYTFSFDFTPAVQKWQTIRITGDWQGVNLYVDGQQMERLGVFNNGKMNVHRTLFFPLGKVGDKKNGFIGEIKNLKIN